MAALKFLLKWVLNCTGSTGQGIAGPGQGDSTLPIFAKFTFHNALNLCETALLLMI